MERTTLKRTTKGEYEVFELVNSSTYGIFLSSFELSSEIEFNTIQINL